MKIIQDVTFGQYIGGNSFIHSLDPRTKLISISTLLPCIFYSKDPYLLSSFGALALFAVLLTGISVFNIINGLRGFKWLFIFAFVFHAFFTPGEPVLYIPMISLEGMADGSTVALQLLLAILFGNLLTLTTPPMELALGMERLFSPLKKIGVPVSDLSMMLLVAIRFIPILRLEAAHILKAQKARGIDLSGGSFLDKAKSIPVILVPLIYNGFKRADDLAVAMVCKGYSPGKERGSLKKTTMRRSDILVISLLVLFVLKVFSAAKG